MGTGYVRNDSGNNIADGNVINASDLDGEFDAIAAALGTSGHTHDGTAAEGGTVTVLGPAQDFVATASVIRPKTDNTLDIGTSGLEFKDLYLDGKAYIDGFGEDTLFDTNKKIQFRDAGLFINSSGDGILDLVSDTELQVTAPTVDINASTAVLISNDLKLDSDAAVLGFGVDNDVTLTHVADTGLLLNSTMALQFNDASQFINAPSATVLDVTATDEIELNATLVDINANLDVSGTALITGVATFTATPVFNSDVSIQDDLLLDSDAAVLSFGEDNEVTITHVADTGLLLNSTMALQFNDASQFINAPTNAILDINATDEIELNATLIDLNGNLDVSGTALVTGVATFTATPVFNADVTIEDDLFLDSDAAVIHFGEDGDVVLTHVADTGLLLGGTRQLQFNDASQFINAPTNAILDINATDEIELNATLIDVNANLDVAGTALVTGVLTTTAATVFNGGFVANDGSTITTADNTTQLTLASTDTDANVGPVLDLFRNVTGATNDEIGRIQFTGKNDAGTDHTYANIASNIVDATSSGNTEDGSLVFQTIVAGSVRDRLNILSDQIVINQEGRDLDFRVESEDLANMFFVDGGNNSVQVGSVTPNLKFWHATNVGPKFLVEQVGTPEAGNYVTMASVRHSADAEGPQLGFAKSRATAAGGVTVAVAGDGLGVITFQGADGTNYIEGARISSTVESGVGGNDMPADLRFFTNRGTTASAESMRITGADGNVLIGKTSNLSAATLLVSGTKSGTNGTNGQLVVLDEQAFNTTDNGGAISFAGNFYNGGQVVFATVQGVKENNTDSNNAGALKFTTKANGANQVEAMRISSGGNVTVSAGNLIIGTAGKGIDFSAQSASGATGASTTSELLDHYEEGTWTPVVAGSSTAGSVSFSARTAFYTRIGRFVHIDCVLDYTISGEAGDLQISGLPFQTAAEAVGSFQCNNMELAYQSNVGQYTARIADNATAITFRGTVTNGGNFASMAAQSMSFLRVAITYQAD